MKPKVLVGAPIFDGSAYAMPKYLEAIKNLSYDNYDYFLVDNSKDDKFFNELKNKNVNVMRACNEINEPKVRLTECRNLLREKALNENYDCFLSLEQDVIPPRDVIEKLMRHNKKVVSGIYCNFYSDANGEDELKPLLYRELNDEEKKIILSNPEGFNEINPETYEFLKKNNFDFSVVRKQLTMKDIEGSRLIDVAACGLGCVLISRNVLGNIKFRVNPDLGFDDMMFCDDLRRLNIKIYADIDVVCRHLIKDKPWKWVLYQ